MKEESWRHQITQIVEALATGVIVINADGRIVFANPEAGRIFGRAPSNLVGKRHDDPLWPVILLDGRRAERKSAFAAVMETGKPVTGYEYAIKRRDGSKVAVSVSATPLGPTAGRVAAVVMSLADITELKLAEREYESMLRASMDGFALLDDKGRIIDVNEAFCRQTGYSREEISQMRVQDISAETAKEMTDHMKKAVAAGSERFQTQIRRKDDAVIDLEVSVNYMDLNGGRLVSFGREITGQKRMEEALQQEKARAEKYLDVAGVMVVAIGADQRVTLMNRKGCQILGYPPEEIIGKNWFDNFLPSEVRQEVRTVFDRLISGEIAPDHFEYFENPVLTKSGEKRHIAWHNTFLRDERGRMVATLSSGEDITERRQTEEALRASEDRYHRLFDGAPVSLWEEDFSDIKAFCDDLRRGGVGDCRAYFEQHPEAVVRCAKLVKIADVNQATLDLYKAKSKEDFRKGLPRLFTKPSYKAFKEEAIALAEGKTRFECQTTNRTLDGRTIDITLRLFVAPGYESSLSKVILSVVDITEHKRTKLLSDALNDINMAIGSISDIDELLERVMVMSSEAIGAETAVIDIRAGDLWEVKYIHGMPPELKGARFTGDQLRHAQIVAWTKQPLVVEDAPTDSRLNHKLVQKYKIKSFLTIPLGVNGDVIGALSFHYHAAPTPFTERELDFAVKLAAVVSAALEKARGYRLAERARTDAEILGRVAARVSETLELDQILDVGLDQALAALDTASGCIYAFDETGKLVMRTQRQLSAAFLKAKGVLGPGEGCAGKAAIEREMFAPTAEERHFVCEESKKLLALDCMAAIPIVAKGESVGVLELFAPVARRLTPRERAMAETIANLLATAIQNARLFTAERDVAGTLQKALLTVPEKIQGLEFGHLYRSSTVEAGEVGGDFYDLFELEHDLLGIIAGDVSGKGLGVATFTSLIKDTIKAYCYEAAVPALVITKTNEMVSKMPTVPVFATVFFGILEKTSGRFSFCNAGHPPPILKKENEILELSTASPAIGVLPGLVFTAGRVVLEKGDILILYTDGVTEARRDGELFGDERLVEFVKNFVGKNPQTAPRLIFDKIMRFSRGALVDDVALLAISRT